jgi:hypothetical protein
VLGLSNVANISMQLDPQGYNGGDDSHYIGNGRITFGGPAQAGNEIPDAADAMVILHEYGHAIQDNVNPGFDNPTDGTGEGFGDFLSAVFYDDKHSNPGNTRGIMMSWDANPGDGTWAGRRYDMAWLFDGIEYTGSFDNHIRGQLWCATMFELYRKLGGDSQWYPGVRLVARDLAIRLHLMANFNVPTSNSTAQEMGQEVQAADSALQGWNSFADGIHKKVIYDTFRRRHLPGYTDNAVDVYIDDGRDGGYGSLSGNDAFNEVLYMDNFWETQDLWVTPNPYPNAQAQQAGTPADHVEPVVNSTAYMYVRVKNRGTDINGSGPITVKAYHCSPGLGLVWPDAWSAMMVGSLNVANVLSGSNNAVVVGPFSWTPTEVGHECVLAIVECANDHAVTQDLQQNDHVRHSDLVPFDNNIAQRNLSPTQSKAKTVRGFWINNPDAEVRAIALDVHNTLPKGWQWRFNVANHRSIRLGPLERRWVELEIDQAAGEEVTRFDQVQQVRVIGTIAGRPIGGLTFYVAPPSAFGALQPIGRGGTPGEIDLCCLGTLLQGAEVEGEIDVKIRFRRK